MDEASGLEEYKKVMSASTKYLSDCQLAVFNQGIKFEGYWQKKSLPMLSLVK